MKSWKFWVGLVISALAAWFALQGIKFDQVGDNFSRLNWWLLALSMIPYFVIMLFKVTRWQLLFYPGPQIRLGRLWATLNMSYLFNTFLPARLGEVVRAYALSRSEKLSPVRVLSTILLEKILDVMTLFVFLLCLLPFVNLDSGIKNAALITGGIVVIGFIVCMLMAAFRRQAESLVQQCLKLLPARFRPKLFSLVTEVLDVLSILLNIKLSLNLWAQSLFQWLLVLINYLMVAAALNFPLSLEQGVVLMVALNLGMVVPSAPGYIGVFEALVKAALLPFFPGQDSQLISLGLLLHISGFLPVILLGAFYTSREGISLGSDVTKKSFEIDSPSQQLKSDGAAQPVAPLAAQPEISSGRKI